MEAMLEKKQSLKELCQGFTVYPQVLKNVEVKDKESAQKDPAVVQAVEDVTNALGTDGRILLRASGTEPLVRVMVEADTQEKCEKYVDQVIAVMKDRGLVLGIR
jgi:phosphoglucosamine mutase